MEEEDYEVLRAESNAAPARFDNYDPEHQFKTQYGKLHPDQREALSRQVTEGQSDASSSSIQLQEIRSNNAGNSMSRTRTRTEEVNFPLERNETALSRIETHRTQHAGTVGVAQATTRTTTRSSKKPLPAFGAGKPYPPPLPAQEEFVVEFDGQQDPLYAQNWPMKKKLLIGSILAFDSLAATMGSSIFSNATPIVSRLYGVSEEVGTLTTSLFVSSNQVDGRDSS